MDLYWRDIAIVEMKAPAEAPRLANHRPQALRYWQESSDVTTGRPAPRYVVLCAFHLFEVWEPGRFPNEPRAGFALADLPDRYDALLFLTAADDDEPLFAGADRALTHKAASAVADLYHALLERNAGAPRAHPEPCAETGVVVLRRRLRTDCGSPARADSAPARGNPPAGQAQCSAAFSLR